MGAGKLNTALLLALAAVCAAPGGVHNDGVVAQTPASDVLRTALVIRPDLATGRLRLMATLDLANPGRARELTFLLADWYDTVLVRSRAGIAQVTRADGEVTVHVSRAFPEDRLVFTLSGAPGQSGGDDRPVLADSSIYLLWSDRFYPADFHDWSIVSTEIEVPAGFRVFAPGHRVAPGDPSRGSARAGGDTRGGGGTPAGRDARGGGAKGLHTERFETTQPIRGASVLADARWVETERTVAGRHLRTLLYPGAQGFADRIFQTSADVLDFYEQRFGAFAFDAFTFATVEGIVARRALVGGVIYEPGYLAQELETTGRDAHETALLWWGYTTAGRGPGSYQWTEGFGDYAEILYDEARRLPVAPILEEYRNRYLRIAGAVDEPPITALRGPRGDTVVHGRCRG